jgi:hypothetical protein
MIELIDTFPDINVQPAEYKRLLGYPRERVLEGRARELADWARAWYVKNGKPWVYAREAKSLEIVNGSIAIDDVAFSSTRLRTTLKQAEAHGVVLVAVSAGPEVEAEAQKLWLEEKPDEYFFLEIFGSAVVEHLNTMMGARLCAWAEQSEMAVLPHYSPGYTDWDISQQPRLLELLGNSLPGKLSVLESGMLKPKKSLLAVFGLTRHTAHIRKLTDLVPCENCSFSPCQYRRAPYSRAPEHSETDAVVVKEDALVVPTTVVEEVAPKYLTNVKALKRWTDERLTITNSADGTIDAVFKYEGTTCTNMGRAIRFHYHVKLSSREQGFVVLDQGCEPAPGDTGYTYMCRYMNNAEHLMVAITQDKALVGQPLASIFSMQRPLTGAGCYCEPNDRKHKWGLVLETIHYALTQAGSRSERKEVIRT